MKPAYDNDPERILLFGSNGSGKSHAWGETAKLYRTTGTPGTFFVLSTEPGTMPRMRTAYPQSDMDPGWDANVVVREVRHWREVEAATREFVAQATADDWFIVEELGKPWEFVRDFYDETRTGYKPIGSNPDPFAVEVDPQRNWQSIKQVFYTWMNSMLNSPAHMLGVAHEDVLRVEGGWKDSKETIETYKYIGMKAVTEKTAPYSLHSVLWMRRTGAQKWSITTVDDHAREYLDNAEVTNFALNYLCGPARWEL